VASLRAAPGRRSAAAAVFYHLGGTAMKTILTTSAALALTLAISPALAGSAHVGVGSNNHVKSQSVSGNANVSSVPGNGGSVSVAVTGKVNNANVAVNGNNSNATVTEKGRINNANVTVTGSGDTVTVDQYGRVNNANVTVTGSGDTVNVVQIGRFNNISAAVFGNDNFVGTVQVGDKNTFNAFTHGNNNAVSAGQFGPGSNFANVVQIGNWRNGGFAAALIEQVSRFNVAEIFQLNSQLQIAFVDQFGQVDVAIITQVADAPSADPPQQAAAAASAVATVFRQAGWAPCGDRPEHSGRWCRNL
jgi:hypothetical protein